MTRCTIWENVPEPIKLREAKMLETRYLATDIMGWAFEIIQFPAKRLLATIRTGNENFVRITQSDQELIHILNAVWGLE